MAVFLTISEAARALDVRESTLRSWRDAFASYVICKVEDGNRLYDLDRLRELQYVCAVWAKQRPRKSMAEVGRELARRYPLEAAAAGLALPRPVDFETLPDLTDGLPQHPYPQYEDRPHVHGPPVPPGLEPGAVRSPDVPLAHALHRLAALAGELGEIKEIQADQLRAQRDLRATVNGLAEILGDIRDAAAVLKELPDLCRRQIEAERRAHAESEAFHADVEAFLAAAAASAAAAAARPPGPSWRRYLSPSHWRAVWRGHLDPPAPEPAPEDRPAIPAPIGSREGP